MKNLAIKIFVLGLILINFCSCDSVSKFFPKAASPFQERTFDSTQWKNGDHQTRGEMAANLVIYDNRLNPPSKVEKKTPDEIIQLLGKPDEMTTASCCYVRSGKTVDVWLYYIEKDNTSDKDKKNSKPLEKKAIEIYFGGEDKNGVQYIKMGDRNGNHAYFPMVG